MAGISLLLSPLTTSSFHSPIQIHSFSYHHHSRTFLCFQNPSKPQEIPKAKSKKPPFPKPTSASRFLDRFRVDEIGLDILNIALPAVLALAADPVTSLVDTAFVGHLGSAELAAVGVSVSIFNLVSKLFNVPLLNVTTSFVAEQQALRNDSGVDAMSAGGGDGENRMFLPAVSTSLALATCIGVVEAIALVFGSGVLMNAMGIPVDSPMRIPAGQFLSLRAFGAPPIVIALAAQGTFRGFLDTKTPLYAIGAGNLLNAILDPILIFLLGLGVSGAAIATVISEIMRYLTSGGLLIGRTISVLLTMTLATSLAAREGPIPMAGHQICLQVWLAVSLLNDALALAGQALLASEYTKRNYEQAHLIVYRVLQIGVATGSTLAIVLFFGFGSFSFLFTTDSAVLDIARSGVWFVTVSQPINAIAFVIDGLYYGVSDFAYAAYSMFLVGIVSSMILLVAAPAFGLAGVWTGLVIFMSLRAIAGFWRLGTKGGPWKMVWSETDIGTTEK